MVDIFMCTLYFFQNTVLNIGGRIGFKLGGLNYKIDYRNIRLLNFMN